MKIGGTLRTRSGFTLLSLAMLATIVGVTVLALMSQISSVRRQEVKLNQQVIAQAYAAELLELFRAFEKSSKLRGYLQTNPAVATNQPYYFCTLINVLDRQNNVILNADPLANLPPSTLDAGTGALAANRYYMIQVVDTNGATFDPSSLCISTYSTVHFDLTNDVGGSIADPFTAASNLRALITVGVSWIPTGGTIADKQEVVLSTVLPTN